MVVRDGGVASGFSTIQEETKLFEGEPELFHIKGSNERDTRAVQVALECQSLNRFSFLLFFVSFLASFFLSVILLWFSYSFSCSFSYSTFYSFC